MKLLCVGDIHLGRRPSRLPEALLAQIGHVPGPTLAWRRTVDYALAHDVDAVLLAGDVVEQADDFYEAYRDLQNGVQRLAGAGIAVLGVAGNHDVAVLPRLADSVDGFRLLGRGGQWQYMTLTGASGTRVRILGWSFPEAQVRTSPLADGLPPVPDDGSTLPILGLLHCDRNQLGSYHAPVRSRELEQAPVAAWLLGHIHKPDVLVGPRPIGYLGSLTGMDPGEAGARGPWLLEVAADSGLSIAQQVIAPLRWETVVVDVSDLDDADAVNPRIVEATRALHEGLATTQSPLAVGCRIVIQGRSQLREAIARTLHSNDPRATPWTHDDIVYFIHDWRLEIQPAIDLATLASGRDPAGLLARRLLALRDPDDPQYQRLVDAARPRLATAASHNNFHALGAEPPDDEQIAAFLEAAALQALDDLIRQKESAA